MRATIWLSTLAVLAILILVIVIVITTGANDFDNDRYRKDLETLELVHVLFRHGDRTNDKSAIYPNDPHKNFTYYPYGHGRLTNKGKLKVYDAGRELREKYERFLQADHPGDVLDARSTASPRAIVSLQLLLAGLFPPGADLTWKHDLQWQPLPFAVIPTRYDKVLQGYKCPNYRQIYGEYLASAENSVNLRNFTKAFDYITRHAGRVVRYFEDAGFLHSCLQIEEEFGLTLPEWTKAVWPEPISSAQHLYYYEMTANDRMIQYTIGFFLKKIINDSRAKIASESADKRKIFVYSAHDYNLGFLLKTLKLFDIRRNPKYAAYITIELHKINNSHHLKFYYQNYNYDEPELLDIPDCGTLCPLDKFERLMSNYLPGDDLRCGPEDQCEMI